jgi:hypothetical protein
MLLDVAEPPVGEAQGSASAAILGRGTGPTVEAGATGSDVATPDIGQELDRVERAVEAGQTDLSALGFWRLVGRIKRDPGLIQAHADQVGRIDGAAFRTRVRWRVPAGVGVILLVVAAIAALGAAIAATQLSSPGWAGLLLLGAGGVWSVAVHDPTHWVVGRAMGIRCTEMFVGDPFPPRPGLKTDYATYLRVPPGRRAWFHASGAIATKLAPFVALLFWPLSAAPGWAAWLLIALGVGQIVTDVVFSVRSSDWKKFRRERAIARSMP